jgi:membrane protein DedA with SNARE-associated domain
MLACLALFGGTFVQEGVALGAGAVLIIGGDVYPIWIVLSLFLGVVSGDCGIYGLGALARQSGWAKRLIASADLKKGEALLSRHLAFAVATSHLVPWVLFPTFAAFGWFKVPFKRFALTSVLFSAVYIPTALLILTTLGTAAWPYLSHRVWILWPLAGTIITALAAPRWRRSHSS